jgi:hypothetical protein
VQQFERHRNRLLLIVKPKPKPDVGAAFLVFENQVGFDECDCTLDVCRCP